MSDPTRPGRQPTPATSFRRSAPGWSSRIFGELHVQDGPELAHDGVEQARQLLLLERHLAQAGDRRLLRRTSRQRRVQPGVLDGQRGPRRELLGQRHIIALERGPARVGRGEGQRADRPSGDRHRDRQMPDGAQLNGGGEWIRIVARVPRAGPHP